MHEGGGVQEGGGRAWGEDGTVGRQGDQRGGDFDHNITEIEDGIPIEQ